MKNNLQHIVLHTAVTKITAIMMIVVMAFGSFSHPVVAATTIEDLEVLIAQLKAQIALMQSGGQSANGTVYVHHPTISYEFSRNLNMGSRGVDVQKLQQILNLDSATRVSQSGAGSSGQETTYFGLKTKLALAKFQAKHGISPAVGYFGPLTRAEINKKSAVVVNEEDEEDEEGEENDTNDEASLTLRKQSNPSNLTVGPGALRIASNVIELEAGARADITLDYILVEIAGTANEDTVKSVALLDEDGFVIGRDYSLDSNDQAKIGRNLIIPKGQKKTFTVAVQMDNFSSSEDGGSFTVKIVDIKTRNGEVQASLPVTGATHIPNYNVKKDKVAIAFDHEDSSMRVGDENQLFVTIGLTAVTDRSNGSLSLYGLRLKNEGSGDLQDLEEVVLETDGKEYDAYIVGDYAYFTFGSRGITLKNNTLLELELRADVTGDASGETYQFVIEKEYDLLAVDANQQGVLMVDNTTRWDDTDGDSLIDTNGDDDMMSIHAGAVQISRSVLDQPEAISVGTDIALGYFSLDIEGEDITIDRWNIDVAVSNGALVSGNTVSQLMPEDVYIMKLDGVRVSDRENKKSGTLAGLSPEVAGTLRYEFQDVELQAGEDVVYVVMGRLHNNITTGTTYQITLPGIAAGMQGVEGVRSDENISVQGGSLVLHSKTIRGAEMVVSMSSSPAARNIDNDASAVSFAKIQFDASNSGEDMDLSWFELQLQAVVGDRSDIRNCRVYRNGTELPLSKSVNGSNSISTYKFQLLNKLQISKNTVQILEVKCDVSADVGDQFNWRLVDSASSVSAKGLKTTNTVSATVEGKTSNTMTVTNASVEITSSSANAPSRQVVAGEEIVLGVIDIHAQDGSVTVNELQFTLEGDSTALVDEKIEIRKGSRSGALLGSAIFSGQDDDYTLRGMNLSVQNGTVAQLYLVATVAEIGRGKDGIDSSEIAVRLDGVRLSNNNLTIVGLPLEFESVRTYSAVPVLEVLTRNQGLTNGDNTVMVFKVTANGQENVVMGGLNLAVNSFGGTAPVVANTRVEVFSNSALTSPVAVRGITRFESGQAGGAIYLSADGHYLEIPKGETYYFRVKLLGVTGVSSGDSILIELSEDITPIQGAFTTLMGLGHHFVWTTKDSFNSNIWFNGYKVRGTDTDVRTTVEKN